MRCNKAIVVNAVTVKVVALTLLYSILAISPSVINPISTTMVYAGTITAPLEQQGILNLSNNEGDSITPVMAASGNSNVYVAWVDDTLDNDAVFMARSIDGGTSFGNATVLSNKNGANSSFPDEPQIAASGSNVYVMWYDNITGSYEPYLVISTDNGTSFSRPINLSHEAGVSNNYAADEYGLLASFSQIAASGNNLYVVWYNNHTGNSQTFLTKSTDGGTSFSRPINLSQIAGIGSSRTVAVNGDNVYVLWSKMAEANDTSAAAPSLDTKTQLLLAKSTDGGSTFSQSIIVTDEGGFSGPPRLDVSANNSVYVAWKQDTVEETETEGIMKILSSRISLAKSTDGGNTFSQPVNIIESESSIDSDFNIASTGNHVYAVWSMDAAQGGLLSEQLVFAAKSTDSGTTFNEVPIEVGNGRFPYVAVSDDNNNWYVVWLYNIGNAEIFFTKVPVNQSSQLTNRNILGTTEGNVEGRGGGRETIAPLPSLTTNTDTSNKTTITGSMPSEQQQQPAIQQGSLAVSIETTDDPIRRGLQQTVIISVEDRNTKQKITGANVIGEVTFKSGSNIVERFSGVSDSSGQVSHRWTIGDDIYSPGRYDIRIQVSAEGYRPTSTSTIFEVD